MGNALIGRLRRSLLGKSVPIWLQSPVTRLLADTAGAIAGVEIERDCRRQTIRATRGVILGSGGFAHNPQLPSRYLPQPTPAPRSPAGPGNTGDLLMAWQAIGPATPHPGDASVWERRW